MNVRCNICRCMERWHISDLLLRCDADGLVRMEGGGAVIGNGEVQARCKLCEVQARCKRGASFVRCKRVPALVCLLTFSVLTEAEGGLQGGEKDGVEVFKFFSCQTANTGRNCKMRRLVGAYVFRLQINRVRQRGGENLTWAFWGHPFGPRYRLRSLGGAVPM